LSAMDETYAREDKLRLLVAHLVSAAVHSRALPIA
jgi:hypothetical protein